MSIEAKRPSAAPAEDLRRRRALGSEGELEVADDLVDRLRVFDEGDDAHLATAEGQRSGVTVRFTRFVTSTFATLKMERILLQSPLWHSSVYLEFISFSLSTKEL